MSDDDKAAARLSRTRQDEVMRIVRDLRIEPEPEVEWREEADTIKEIPTPSRAPAVTRSAIGVLLTIPPTHRALLLGMLLGGLIFAAAATAGCSRERQRGAMKSSTGSHSATGSVSREAFC